MLLGALIYLPVTFLTRHEEMDHLVKYYVMSRPIGFWGPVRREADRRGLLRHADAGLVKGDLSGFHKT